MKDNRATEAVPTLDKLINPMLAVYHGLGGSGSNDQILEGVARQLHLDAAQLEALNEPANGKQTSIANRLSVARRYLKHYGLLDNPKPKLWSLTEKGKAVTRVNPFAVILHAERRMAAERLERQAELLPDLTDLDATLNW